MITIHGSDFTLVIDPNKLTCFEYASNRGHTVITYDSGTKDWCEDADMSVFNQLKSHFSGKKLAERDTSRENLTDVQNSLLDLLCAVCSDIRTVKDYELGHIIDSEVINLERQGLAYRNCIGERANFVYSPSAKARKINQKESK